MCAGSSDAVYKRWLKNTNFENPLNWNVQPPRAPCGNDRVIIPDDSPVVYFQMNTTLQELVSELVLLLIIISVVVVIIMIMSSSK